MAVVVVFRSNIRRSLAAESVASFTSYKKLPHSLNAKELTIAAVVFLAGESVTQVHV